MNNENAHLLTKHGILNNFHIIRKIKSSFINSLKRKYKKQGLSAKEIKRKINDDTISYTKKFLNENNIPGLIYEDHRENNNIPQIDDKTRDKIVKLSEYCKNFSIKNKFDTDHVILFVQLFLHTLDIKNSDVEDFKNRYNINNSENLNEDDEDDEDRF